jgi:tetratricopeptide (TPR) repeat protein
VNGETWRAWRLQAGWDVPETARRLRQAAGSDPVPAHDTLVKQLRRRERDNAGVSERYVLLFARALDVPAAELAGGPPPGRPAARIVVQARDDDAGQGWPGWFGIRLARLVTLTDTWQHLPQLAALQALLTQEIVMSDAAIPPSGDSDRVLLHELSRRHALATIAALPAAALAPAGGTRPATQDAFLARCAVSLAACWHLMRGSDLDAAARALSPCLLPLDAAARRESRHQQAAAALAAQAHRICGIIALHRQQLAVREQHCRQAVELAAMSGDPGANAAALISLASTWFYAGDPERAAASYEGALAVAGAVPPLLRSRAHAEAAVAYAQLGRVQDALRGCGLARDLYPASPDADPAWLYAEWTPASLALEEGLSYAALAASHPGRGYSGQAAGVFARAAGGGQQPVPDRIRYEAIARQATVTVLDGDLDGYEELAAAGLAGAVMLGSVQRYRELRAAWQQASARWPGSRRVAAAGDALRESSATCGPA